MQLSNGLQDTVDELLALPKDERELDAEDFIEYFEAAKDILTLQRGDVEHIFVHAGVTREVFGNRNFSEFDYAAFRFQEVPLIEDMEKMVREAGKESRKYVIHTGHNYGYHGHKRETYETRSNQDGTLTLVEHDIGFGKTRDSGIA